MTPAKISALDIAGRTFPARAPDSGRMSVWISILRRAPQIDGAYQAWTPRNESQSSPITSPRKP